MGTFNNQALGLPQLGMTSSSLLTGYTIGSNTPVTASDTLLGAIGKLQAQITSGGGGGGITLSSAITGYTVGANTALTATDTILQAFGKLQGQVTAREAALGNPPADGYTLVSTAAGVRSWAAPGAAAAGGSNTQVQYNNGGVLSGSAALTFDATTNTLYRAGTNPTINIAISTTEPGSAPTDTLTWYVKRVAGCVVPKFIGPSGGNTPFQSGMWQNRIILWSPGTGTSFNAIGHTATVASTVSHPTPATGALGTVMYRTQFTTSTTAGTASGARSGVGVALIGNASNPGGFFFVARFNQGSLHTNGVQKMVGLSSSTAALAGEPSSTMADFIGMSLDSTDTTWQFTRRTGTGTATKVDLGVTPAANQVFELIMYIKPGASELFVRIQQFANDGTPTTLLDTSYTTSLPVATSFLGMHCQVRNGSLAAAHNIAFAKMYLESAF